MLDQHLTDEVGVDVGSTVGNKVGDEVGFDVRSAVDIEVGKLALMQDKHFAMKLIGDEVGVDVLMQDQQLADEVGVDVGSAVGSEVEDEFGFELDQLLAELLS